MRLGIDFGTTNSSIARFDGRVLDRLELDPANDNRHVLPSLIYIDRHQQPVVGTQAATQYLERETGRTFVWEKRPVGEIDVVGADMSFVRTVHAMVDTAAQGRLLQYVKTALRDPTYDGTQVFERFYTVDELIAILLQSLKCKAEEAFGEETRQVVIGRPVRFSDQPAVTARAEEILFRAARRAGFEDIRFEMEPIGAMYYYHRSAPRRQTALVFDFGGGTLDLTVAEVGGDAEPRILATHGVLVGGDDLDRRLMQSLQKHFGADALVDGKPALPAYLFDWLDNWQTMPILSRPDFVRLMDEAIRSGTNKRGVRALKSLVTKNLGFKLFREIEQAKKQLSDKWITHLRFEDRDISIDEAITRREFETLIAREVEQAETGVREALELAGLDGDGIDIVLRTGGTSAVPVFAGMLAGIFGQDKLAEMDLLTSVVGGLAIVAHEGGGVKPRYATRYDTADTPVPGSIRVKGTMLGERYPFGIGQACYRDQPYALLRIPVELSSMPAIRTAQADKNLTGPFFISFDLARTTRVYIAYDANAAALPQWLRAFKPENMQIAVDQSGAERRFRVYAQDFAPGHVRLGGNRAQGSRGEVFMNYLVILAPILD